MRGVTDKRKGYGLTVWWRQWSGSGGEGVWWRVEAQEAPERLRIARSIDGENKRSRWKIFRRWWLPDGSGGLLEKVTGEGEVLVGAYIFFEEGPNVCKRKSRGFG